MKKHARVVTGLFTIILLLSIWVYHIMEARSLTGSLAAEAAVLQAAFAQPEDGPPGFDVTVETVAARDIPLLGRIRGKITVYTRSKDVGREHVYSALEHFYTYEAGDWRLTESGGCSGPECQIRATRAFQNDQNVR